jgi:hypothetical protein
LFKDFLLFQDITIIFAYFSQGLVLSLFTDQATQMSQYLLQVDFENE